MNKSELFHILKKIIIKKNIVCDGVEYIDVHSDLQSAKSNMIVFYNLRDGKIFEDALKKRLNQSDNCLLIITRMPKFLENRENVLVISSTNFLEAQKKVLDIFYPITSEKTKIVGVTGTNGKTTVVNLATQIAKFYGKKTASLGTVGLCDNDGLMNFGVNLTTPSYIDLRKILYRLKNDYDCLFMELSSHALDQNRTYDIFMDMVGWTNFSQDHLDYHKDMESYFKAKLKILEIVKENGLCVVPNEEDELIIKLKEYEAEKIVYTKDVDTNNLPEKFKYSFNYKNLLLALKINELLWKTKKNINFKNLELPKGRYSIIKYIDSSIIIDFAHTPDAIENVCKAIKKDFKDNKFYIIFGCGGDRDNNKRHLMGKIAEQYADVVIVTSDNPRSEKQDKIINDILEGVNFPNKVIVNNNRKQAILDVMNNICEKSVVLIAGKGHEEYQEIDGIRHPYSDFTVINEFFQKKDK